MASNTIDLSGTQISNFVSNGPLTFKGTSSNPSYGTVVFNTSFYRRVNDSLEFQWSYCQSSAGSNGSGTYLIPLPAGMSIDFTKLQNPTSGSNVVIDGNALIYTGNRIVMSVRVYDANNVFLSGLYTGGEGDWSDSFAGFSNAILECSGIFTVPIVGWNS